MKFDARNVTTTAKAASIAGILIAAFGGAAPAHAAGQPTAATIAAVQMPAWLERGGMSLPLSPGMAVKNGDRLRTGADARAMVKLAEGSSLKLGENAALDFYSRSLKPASHFKGAFDLKAGALRFTGAQGKAERDITLRVGGKLSANVAGADLWAGSEAARDHLLLLGGRTEVRHGGQSVELAEPASAFSIGKGSDAQEVVSLDAAQLNQRVQATDLVPGRGLLQAGSPWRVLVARANSQPDALSVYDRARAAGYAAQIKVRDGGASAGERWQYDVVVGDVASQQDAAALAAKVAQQLGVAAQAAGR